MSNDENKDSSAGPSDNRLADASHEELPSRSRRRFSRTALASSAVLLSLGNRTAWGQTVVGCMSVATLDSFNPSTGMFQSAPGSRPEHNEALAAEIHHVAGSNTNGDYLAEDVVGSDGSTVYSTCQDPALIDGVCLIEDDSCP
ncbi:MAG: hypothetical protein GY764_15995 [Halieaceae bacterium]|nr:hypothetical protein [Halieaceae bacterium]MCP4466425.1 hypothetical protein [Halieaceae bacterium]MCP4840259.1 hypothetical protein [Halieaceae bacterium]